MVKFSNKEMGTNQDTMDTNKNTQTIEMSKKDKSLILTILLLVIGIGALAVAGFMFINPEEDIIQGQGDATEIRISGKLPGRVEDIYVKEGDYVHAGDTLIHIKSTLAEAKLAQANAMQEAAQAADSKVDAGTRSQVIESARGLYDQAKAATSITRKTYERMENLYKEGVISAQKRDEAKAAYEAAVAGENAAKGQLDLALAGAQSQDKQAAEAMVKAAHGSVKEVDALLEDQYLLAPYDGQIVEIYPHESELVALGAPLMTLQKDDHWAVFNLRENMLKDIKLGKKVKVKIPALDKETEMEVYYIKDLGSYANWQATKATGSYDARTFQVKMRPAKPIEGFRPGMSVLLLQ